MNWLLLLALLGAEPPAVEILQPHISVQQFDRDIRDLPQYHLYLIEHARRLNESNRETYFARLDQYLDEAVDCSNPEKVGWFLELAHRTWSTPAVRDIVVPQLNGIILEEPACFLAAVQNTGVMAEPGQLFDRFVVAPEFGASDALEEALLPALSTPRFSSLARLYDERVIAYQERLAREEERRQRKLSFERSQYRQVLKDPAFMKAEPREYWSRWEEITRKARDCKDIDAIGDLLDAALMHAENGLRNRSAEFVELLAMDNPVCILNGMEEMRYSYKFARYLQQPVLFSAVEVMAPLAYANVEGDAQKHRQSIFNDLEDLQRERRLDAFTGARFLWHASIAYSDPSGRIFITPPAFPGAEQMQARLESLWAQARPADKLAERHFELRLLPLEAVEFLTNGEYPSYQLLDINRDGVRSAKARATGAAIMDWYCKGRILLLELTPESVPSGDETYWSHPAVLAFGEEQDLPAISEHRFNSEDWFTYGRLTWPLAGRSMDYQYSSAYTDIILRLNDNQTGEERFAAQTGWSCH